MKYAYRFELRELIISWKVGRFSFVTSIIFMLNRLGLRSLFLDGLAWWNPLKGYPVLTNFVGILVLFLISMLIASIIVSNMRVNLKIRTLHRKLLYFPRPSRPPFHERCVIFFMKIMTTICFYACKYKVVKYSLYFIGFLLMVVYCFTESLTPLIILWVMSSLQKYCTYVVLRMFDPKRLYLDLNYVTFRDYKNQYYLDSLKYGRINTTIFSTKEKK